MSCLGTNKLSLIFQYLEKINMGDARSRRFTEKPEQELIAKFLPSDCYVLEFGGESGTTSLIIDKILKYPERHVVVEPSPGSIQKLNNTKRIYNTQFKIAHGFLGKNREFHEKLWNDCKNCKMWSLVELQNLVGSQFDVLIVDCEGAFYNILNDFPEILDNIKLIIIEMDGPDKKIPEIREKLLKNKFELVHTQVHPYINSQINDDKLWARFSNVNDFYKLKLNKNLIGFHEVYIKY